MLVPTKGIAPDRALLTVGAQIVQILDRPLTVSQAWAQVRMLRSREDGNHELPFWWFALALDILFALGAIEFQGTILRKIDNRDRVAV